MAIKQATKKFVGDYIFNNGVCPYCRESYEKPDLISEKCNSPREGIIVRVECSECGQEWVEIYKLATIEYDKEDKGGI